jgi:hypothetical protein
LRETTTRSPRGSAEGTTAFGWNELFDVTKHAENESYIDEFDGLKRARSQWDNLVKKGQDLPTSGKHHAKIDLMKRFYVGQKREITTELLTTDATRAPKSSKHKASRTDYENNESGSWLTFPRRSK